VLKKNLAANYLGELVVAALQIAMLPVYLHYLGPEAYGIMAFHTTLTAFATITTLGIIPTFTREISRLSASIETKNEIRGFARTYEVFYILVVFFFTIFALFYSVDFVALWLNPNSMDFDEIYNTIILIYIQIAAQLIFGFYLGGLQGLDNHVVPNSINSIGTFFKLTGAFIILSAITTDLYFLYVWLIFSTAVLSVLSAIFFYRQLPTVPGSFQLSHITRTWRYAIGVTGTAIVSIALTQVDKLTLSRLVSLSDFGSYALAAAIAAAPGRPLAPIVKTFFPRMTAQFITNDLAGLVGTFHLGSQLASLVVIPASIVGVFFPKQIIFVLLGNPIDVTQVADLFAILVIGFGGMGLLAMHYHLTLAAGWPQFGFYQNLIAVCFMVPATIVLSIKFGTMGAAAAWAFFHKRVLRGELRNWYLKDFLPPLAASIATCALLKFIVPFGFGRIFDAGILALIGIATVTAALLSLGILRRKFWEKLVSLKKV
jgi:O-antigen/teichoic acid export membrane protein